MTTALLNGFIFAYCLTFGLSFLVSTFVILPIKERANGSKHSQFISGVTVSSYWLTSFVWDLVKYTIPAFCIIAVIEAFQIDAYVRGIHIWYVLMSAWFNFQSDCGLMLQWLIDVHVADNCFHSFQWSFSYSLKL
jgi:ABC-2 family transporter protein